MFEPGTVFSYSVNTNWFYKTHNCIKALYKNILEQKKKTSRDSVEF